MGQWKTIGPSPGIICGVSTSPQGQHYCVKEETIECTTCHRTYCDIHCQMIGHDDPCSPPVWKPELVDLKSGENMQCSHCAKDASGKCWCSKKRYCGDCISLWD